MGTFSSEERLLWGIEKLVRKGIDEYGMITEGDSILIGFSGGKDSFALVELLARRSRIFAPRFQVYAVHVVMDNIPYQADLEAMESYCNSWGVPFVVRHTSFDAATDHRKSPCFLCSWNRRKLLFETAKELGCNKIALGHHKDDILHTLLMNLVFQGAVSTMPPLLRMEKFDMEIIRPLSLVDESQLVELCSLRQYPLQKKSCPYEKESHRSQMRELVDRMEQMNPRAKASLWGAMSNIQVDYLPQRKKK